MGVPSGASKEDRRPARVEAQAPGSLLVRTGTIPRSVQAPPAPPTGSPILSGRYG